MKPRPIRLQRSRAKGSRLVSPNSLPVKVVTRPGPFGNPYATADEFEHHLQMAIYVSRHDCSLPFRGDATSFVKMKSIARRLGELRGKNLACWCKPGTPCHADFLLKAANS